MQVRHAKYQRAVMVDPLGGVLCTLEETDKGIEMWFGSSESPAKSFSHDLFDEWLKALNEFNTRRKTNG